MAEKTKNVEVTIYRTVRLRNEHTFVVNVPADASSDEIEQGVEAHLHFEPWDSAAEIDVSEVDAGDYGGQVGVEFVSDETRLGVPDVILVRNWDGDLVMEDLVESDDEDND